MFFIMYDSNVSDTQCTLGPVYSPSEWLTVHTKVYRAKQPHERDQSRSIVDELIENKAL